MGKSDAMTDERGIVKALHHAVFVSDLERSTGFYNRLLGMKPTYSIEGQGTIGYLLFPGAYLNLCEDAGLSDAEGLTKCEVPILTLVVDDLDAACKKLSSIGASLVSERLALSYANKQKFRDPDGNLLALAD